MRRIARGKCGRESRADGFGFEEAAILLSGTLSAPLQSVLNAMWKKDNFDDKNVDYDLDSPLYIAMESFLDTVSTVQTCTIPREQTNLELQVIEKIAFHTKTRESLGFIEIEKSKIDDFKNEILKMKIEKEEMIKITKAMRVDILVTKIFSDDKKVPKGTEDSESGEAKEIANKKVMTKKHSRRLSFS